MSRLVGDDVYTVIVDVDLPEEADAEALAADLQTAARELGIDLTFRASDTAEL
jgi:glycine cleavage system transcriptional repressor